MMATETYVCLDFGNTDLKVAFFEKGQLLETKRFQNLDKLIGSIPADLPVAVSSVREKLIEERLIKNFKNLVVIHSNLKLPFVNDYATPATLGIDRLCNASALSKKEGRGAKLSIDIGTCIKFDFLSGDNHYLGGQFHQD